MKSYIHFIAKIKTLFLSMIFYVKNQIYLAYFTS